MLSFLKKAGSRILGAITGGLVGLVSGIGVGCYAHLRSVREWPQLLFALTWGPISGGVRSFVKGIQKGGSEGLTAGATYYKDVYQYYFAKVDEIEQHAEEVRKAELPKQFPIDFLTDDQYTLLSAHSKNTNDNELKAKLEYYAQFYNLRDPITITTPSQDDKEAKTPVVYSRERYLSWLEYLSSRASTFTDSFVTPTFTMGFPDKLIQIISDFRQLLSELRQASSAKPSPEQPTSAYPVLRPTPALSPKSAQHAATAGVGLWQPAPQAASAPSLSVDSVASVAKAKRD